VRVFSHEFLGSTVASFKGMRSELVRMGFGPFEDWEFITSGMHAVRSRIRFSRSKNVSSRSSPAPPFRCLTVSAPRVGWDADLLLLAVVRLAQSVWFHHGRRLLGTFSARPSFSHRHCDAPFVCGGFSVQSGAGMGFSPQGPYWFTGRNVAPRSGRTQHAWDHERMILRMLYGSGLINICTS